MGEKTLKLFIILIVCSLFTLSGCATLKRKDLTQQELRNQIQVLEQELKKKDEEISSLKTLLEQKQQSQLTKTYSLEAKSRPSVKQIQIALKNAGYNPGPIDGKMGRQTRQAIKAFQKANGLIPDGKMSKKTWSILRKYLYQKEK
jgi:peptidoglycan hydrolase-like protein with peptidoglycan-binding domain